MTDAIAAIEKRLRQLEHCNEPLPPLTQCAKWVWIRRGERLGLEQALEAIRNGQVSA